MREAELQAEADRVVEKRLAEIERVAVSYKKELVEQQAQLVRQAEATRVAAEIAENKRL